MQIRQLRSRFRQQPFAREDQLLLLHPDPEVFRDIPTTGVLALQALQALEVVQVPA